MSRHQYPSQVSDLLELAVGRDDPSWFMAAEESALRFLEANESGDWTVIHAYLGVPIYLHSLLAPQEQIRRADTRELMDRFPCVDDGWRIRISYPVGKPDDIRIRLVDSMTECAPLRGGEKLVFARRWDGGDDDYDQRRIEVSQRLAHSLGLHHVPERDAFCRLDRHGDIEDVIKIVRPGRTKADAEHVILAIRRREFHEYVAILDMCIVTQFDFNFLKNGCDWRKGRNFENFNRPRLFYDGGIEDGRGTLVHGGHVVIPDTDRVEIARNVRDRLEGRTEGHATFKGCGI